MRRRVRGLAAGGLAAALALWAGTGGADWWHPKYDLYRTYNACGGVGVARHTAVTFVLRDVPREEFARVAAIRFEDAANGHVEHLPLDGGGAYYVTGRNGVAYREFTDHICDGDGGDCVLALQWFHEERDAPHRTTDFRIVGLAADGSTVFDRAVRGVVLPRARDDGGPVFRRIALRIEGSEIVASVVPDGRPEPVDLEVQYAVGGGDMVRHDAHGLDPASEREVRVPFDGELSYAGALVNDLVHHAENKVEVFDRRNRFYACGAGSMRDGGPPQAAEPSPR